MTAREAIELYKSRDASEKLFRSDKSYLGNKSMRVYSDEALSSKVFIQFIALILRSRIYIALKEKSEKMLKRPNYLTVPAALKELEKIVMIRQLDGVYRLDHAVTATQKTILDAFGLNEGNVRYQAKEIEKILQQPVRKTKEKKDMARMRRSSEQTLEYKIEQAEAKVAKTREAHEKAVDELKKLYDIRKAYQRDELLKAMKNSSRSYEEILAFITSGETSEDEQNRTE